MTEYRILRNWCGKFKIQKKFLWVFWKDVTEYTGGAWGGCHYTKIFDTHREACLELKDMRKVEQHEENSDKWEVVGTPCSSILTSKEQNG